MTCGPILITGGTGFIGSHFCRRLVAEGHEVHLLVRRTSSLEKLVGVVDRVRLWEGDLLQPDSLGDCFEGARPTVVYSLAGTTDLRHYQDDFSDVVDSIQSTLVGSLNLIRAAALASRPPKRYFIAGSLAEYGNGPIPYRESQREAPITSHGAGLTSLTHYVQSLSQRVPFALTMLRFALVYGPGQSDNFLIPSLIDTCLHGRRFTLRQARAGRDLLFIDDLIEALYGLRARDDLDGELINIASGEEHRVGDIARLVTELTTTAGAIQTADETDGGLEHLCGDPEKAAALLGWRATTSLEDGLAQTIAWHRAQRAA